MTADILLLLVRWVHAVSAVAWVGGGVFYLVVLRPALQRTENPGPVLREVHREYHGMTDVAIIGLLVSGMVLSLSRLTSGRLDVAYAVVLAVKVALALYSFALILSARRGRALLPASMSRAVGGTRGAVVAGLIAFLLSDVLRQMFEGTLG